MMQCLFLEFNVTLSERSPNCAVVQRCITMRPSDCPVLEVRLLRPSNCTPPPPLSNDSTSIMDSIQCYALRDLTYMERCENDIHPSNSAGRFCSIHSHECQKSVERYKAASAEVMRLQARAVETPGEVGDLVDTHQITHAISVMMRLVDALEDEAEQRTRHSQQFFWDSKCTVMRCVSTSG